jgi:mono/diheme cytochrome c family protein
MLDGAQFYEVACVNCHGDTGRGVDRSRRTFDTPLPRILPMAALRPASLMPIGLQLRMEAGLGLPSVIHR